MRPMRSFTLLLPYFSGADEPARVCAAEGEDEAERQRVRALARARRVRQGGGAEEGAHRATASST